MSIHSHPFPLNSNTSSFMHIHFKFLANISPTQLTKHENNQRIPYCCHTRTNNRKSWCFHTRTSSKKRSLVVSTKEPVVRKESLLLPHKNQHWEEIKQLLEGSSFHIWEFLCMWKPQIFYGCNLRKWCMRACFAFSLGEMAIFNLAKNSSLPWGHGNYSVWGRKERLLHSVVWRNESCITFSSHYF